MQLFPKLGVGPIRFGMSESEVRVAFSDAPNTRSRRDAVLGTWSLYFGPPIVTIEFDEHDRCCAIELGQGAIMVYGGRNLNAMTYGALVKFVLAEGYAINETESGFRCEALGLSCYSPDAVDSGSSAAIVALMAFRENYYEDGAQKIARAGGWKPS